MKPAPPVIKMVFPLIINQNLPNSALTAESLRCSLCGPSFLVEFPDFLHYCLLHLKTDLRIDRQRHRLIGCALRLREITFFVPERSETFLKMKGHRIIHLGTNPFLLQELPQAIPIGNSKDELIVDMVIDRAGSRIHGLRKDYTRPFKKSALLK